MAIDGQPPDQAEGASGELLRLVAGPDLSAQELHDLLTLRVDVFVVEQECAYHELDGRDLEPSTEHLWYRDDNGISASVRLLADPAGRRIGRVVTRADRRGEGLSARLLREALHHIGDQVSVLDAQSHLRNFYERLGFFVHGPEFVEDGIPHLPMTNDVQATPNVQEAVRS